MVTKSLYNKQSIINAVDSARQGQYGIKINAVLGKGDNATAIVIDGILKEAIGFSVDASWQTIGLESIIQSIMSSNPILGVADTMLDMANLVGGSSFTNTGIFSKLFYKNSGRLGISPSFRVFDFNGTGNCTKVATVLSALCIPTIGDSIPLRPIVERVQELAKPVEQIVDAGAKAAGPGVQKFVNREKEIISTGAETIAKSSANWSDGPNPVDIEIGTWLKIKQAVVENVSINFSYECTDAGPLWVDVSMKMQTIENLAIGTDGYLQQVQIGNGNSSRVQIVQGNQIFTPPKK